MAVPSAQVADAARKFADRHSARLAAAAKSGLPIFATVSTVTAGGASDGNALVKVTWRGQADVPTNGYVNSYTPTEGDRVVCVYDGKQLIVIGKVIGKP